MRNKPFNGLFSPLPKVFSENTRAGEVMGLRGLGGAIPFDQPCELGYHCPVCKYQPLVDGNFDERLFWSQYKGFLWCAVCNKDYPSCLCQPDLDAATKLFLDCIEEAYDAST